MSSKVGQAVGNYIGCFVTSDARNFDGNIKTFMRVRVAMDIRKPLVRKMKLKREGNGDWFWVNFRYERLPTFCFYCGFMGHSDKFYVKLLDNPSHPSSSEFVYGIWLRAQPRRLVNRPAEKWLRQSGKEFHASAVDDEVDRM